MNSISKVEQLKKALQDRVSQDESAKTRPFKFTPVNLEYYPLTPTQFRLYHNAQMHEDSTMYNLSIRVCIKGGVDFQKLNTAFQKLIRRHSILRTQFLIFNGEIVQKIFDKFNFNIQVLSGRKKDLDAVFRSFVKPFNLRDQPLIRAALFSINPTEHQLFIDLPHIVADGITMSLFLRDLLAIYEGIELDPPYLQYKDYAVWYEQQMRSNQFDQSKKFWDSYLQRHIEGITFSRAQKSNTSENPKGSTVPFVIEAEMAKRIRRFTSEQKVTPYIFFLTTYHVLLMKLFQKYSLVVGTTTEGRIDAKLRNVGGPFINILPIISSTTPTSSLLNLLHQIKGTLISCIEHQYFPFDQASSISRIKKNASPLINTFFDLHQDRLLNHSSPSLNFTILPVSTDSPKFPLSIEVIDKSFCFDCHVEFDLSYFSFSNIENLIASFLSITNQFVQDPDLKLINVHTQSPDPVAECKRNFTEEEKAKTKPFFLDYFYTQASKTPFAIAAQCHEQQISYECLNLVSQHVAQHLVQNNITCGDLIALHMERSVYFLVSILATFKIGAAYIPLDLKTPTKRQRKLIDDSCVKLVLVDRLQEFPNVNQLEIKKLLDTPVPYINLRSNLCSSDISYMIYTSGSTGSPKGVMVEHIGMMNHILAKIEDFGISQNDRIAQTASQTFDVSVWQFLAALTVGAKVVIFPDDEAWCFDLLFKGLEESQITIYETVPSHLTIILEELDRNSPPILSSLRLIMLNGEPLFPHFYNTWNKYYPTIRMSNVYGPTECSDDVTHLVNIEKKHTHSRTIPIGKTITNLQGYVLDEFSSPLPIGFPGELCISGVGLARGYFNRPDTTAELFIPSPFGYSARMYRTGDHVVLNNAGEIEHLGRIDSQIKINGQRVEIEEIEAVISSHEDVYQSAVIVEESGKGSTLFAFVNTKPKTRTESIVSFLKDKLPNYMIPTINNIQIVETFPITSSGKINKKELRELKKNNPPICSTRKHTVKNETELTLVKICEEILNTHIDDTSASFFEVGGHSLLATQLVGRILKHFKIQVSIRDIYLLPTLADLAVRIEELLHASKEYDAPLPEITPDPINKFLPFPMTEVQQAYWLGRKGIFSLGDVSVHVYAEYESPELDLNKLEKAWNILIQRHDALRIVFDENGSQRILKNVDRYIIGCLDLSLKSLKEIEIEQEKYRKKYSHEIFPADRWPLFSIRAIKKPSSFRLFLSFDAMIIDGWSVDILFHEWMKLYKNIDHVLSPLELSYRDYVLSLGSLRSHPRYLRDKQYWVDRLDNFPGAPALPLVRQPQQINSQHFSRCSKMISKDFWNATQQIIREHQLSPTGFIAFIFSEVLLAFSGNEKFAINLTLFDRPALHPEINHLAGDFTTLTLLEVCGKRCLTLLQRAQKLQNQLWQDLDHHMFGGIEFIRALSASKGQDSSQEFPVVLTSVLGLDDQQNIDLNHFFGREVFSITQTPQVWLDFKAYEVGGNLILEWDYVTELFQHGFIEKMHDSYCRLLECLTKDNTLWKSDRFNFLCKSESQARILYNSVNKEHPRTLMYSDFEKLCRLHPERFAIEDCSRSITYGELYRSSLSVASRLSSNRVDQGLPIATIMNKGWEHIAAVIGVQIAGCAFLPIDKSYPSQRIDSLLELSNTKAIITQTALQSELETFDYIKKLPKQAIIYLNEAFIHKNKFRRKRMRGGDLAYLIFTSGSTGTPKGVMISHSGAQNTIQAINKKFNINNHDSVLALSPISFDLSIYDIFGLLSVGGKLIIPNPIHSKDPSHWSELLIKHKVTIWNTVPMFMQMLVEYAESLSESNLLLLAETLRLIFLSGDWIPTDLPKRIHQIFPKARIISLGGATEASIWSIYYEIDPTIEHPNSIPYGYPLDNQSIHVLDSEGKTKPETVPGELYIGGEGLACGYWNDADKTAQNFLQHPTLGRLYKTGDVGAFNPRTGIEFLGRKDSQVKVGGYRIELGEIKSIIEQHPDVSQAVILTEGGDRFSQRLYAYLTKFSNPINDISLNGIIAKESDRTRFVIEKHGLEPISPESKTVRLTRLIEPNSSSPQRRSHRYFEGAPLSKDTIFQWIYNALVPLGDHKRVSSLSIETMSLTLESLAVIEANSPVYRYPYPSAGSLYAVQTFLQLSHDCGELKAERYYYHPEKHTLVRQDSGLKPLSSSIQLLLKLEAIEPMYGKFAQRLAQIEAGYMLALITERLASSHIPFNLTFGPKNLVDLLLEIPQQGLINYPDIYIWVKEDSSSGVLHQWYQYKIKTQKIEKLRSTLEFSCFPSLQDSYAISQQSSGGVFFVSCKDQETESIDSIRSELTMAGYFGQKLMDTGLRYHIGGCPLARLDSRSNEIISRVTQGQHCIHYFLFGSLTNKQMLASGVSNYISNALANSVEKYILHKLPKYMIPERLIEIDQLPLNPNGKIDTNMLRKQITSLSIQKKVISEPINLTESKLLSIWRSVLKKDTLGTNESFFEVGGNSLHITKMALEVRKTFNSDIPLYRFFEANTIQDLAKIIDEKHIEKQGGDFIEDTYLCRNLNVCKNKSSLQKGVFLTGATGFLGSHILKNLVEDQREDIYCLVRANSSEEAIKKLQASQRKYQLLDDSLPSKIIPILGDLSRPQLGMKKEDIKLIERYVGTIIHNGAFVHHVYDYSHLRNSNVLSSTFLIDLAARNAQRLVYISSLLSIVDRTEDGLLEEDFPSGTIEGLQNGYQKTKWVNEMLLKSAHLQGLDICIFRPNTISGQTHTGITSFSNDHLLLLIKGCIQMGYAPIWNERIDLLPVDFVSQCISSIGLSKSLQHPIFNVASKTVWTWISLVECLQKRGFSIELIPAKEWKNKHLSKISPINALFPLLSLYLTPDSFQSTEDITQPTMVAEIHHFKKEIKKLGIPHSTTTHDYLNRLFSFLEQEKFLLHL